jgi:inorganic pyrophosphatase
MANEVPQRSASKLGPFNLSGELNVVIETPKGSRNKYKYDAESGLFSLHKLMPTGTMFPFDFGFLPSTQGADGDPLDVLVLIDEPVSVGCLVAVRLIGVIEARQTENRKTQRNDRLIGVAASSHLHKNVLSLRDESPGLLDEIERFFVFYNEMQDRKFKALGRHGPTRARRLIREGKANFEGKRNLQETKRLAKS